MNFTAFYMVTRNDFCLEESIKALQGQGVKRFILAIPTQYWNGDPVRLEDAYDLQRIGERIPYVTVHYVDIRGFSETYAEKEAWVRKRRLSTPE